MDENKLKAEIQGVIQDVVPQMIFDSLSVHTHQGGDSPNLEGSSVLGAPSTALTTSSAGTLSSGGLNNLTSSDSAILTNMKTRIDELESRLQALGLLS